MQDEVIKRVALKYQLDPRLVKAIIKQESAFNPMVFRYEPTWRYFPSDVEVKLYAANSSPGR